MKNLNARNPLSIIALFISLIYGISALLLGASVDKLTPDSQDRLVWFVIGFPIGILLAFLYLVTWHHRKLYSPSDFRTDESFLTSGDPKAIGTKYIEEGQTDVDNSQTLEGSKETSPAEYVQNGVSEMTNGGGEAKAKSKDQPSTQPPLPRENHPGPSAFAAYAYLVEGLVMQELQNEYKKPIRRDAVFPMKNGLSARVDGIVEGPSGPLVVEIKLIKSKGDFARRIRDASGQLCSYIATAREIMNPKTSGILAVVLDDDFQEHHIDRIKAVTSDLNKNDITVRIIKSKDLMRKYGLSSPRS